MDNKIINTLIPLMNDHSIMVRIPEVGEQYMEVLMFLDDIHYIDHTVLVGGMILNIKHIPRGTFAYWNIMDVDSIKIEEK